MYTNYHDTVSETEQRLLFVNQYLTYTQKGSVVYMKLYSDCPASESCGHKSSHNYKYACH